MSPSLETSRTKAASIKLILKTSAVQVDSPDVEVAYQLTDVIGRPQVLLSDLEVTMALSAPASASVTCTQPDVFTGVGKCLWAAPTSLFSDTGDTSAAVSVTVAYGGAQVAWRGGETVTLVKRPSHAAETGAGMTMFWPQHPLFPGETFGVPITANTGEETLNVWRLEFYYDATIFEYVSTTNGGLFTAPVENSADTGKLGLVTSGILSDESACRGDAVPIVTVNLRVKLGAAAGTYDADGDASDADTDASGAWNVGDSISQGITCLVQDMVTTPATNSIKFVDNEAAQVNDARSSSIWREHWSAQVEIMEQAFVGAYAYALNHAMMNTAALSANGAAVIENAVLIGVYNRAGSSDMTLVDGVGCSSSAPQTLAVSGACTLMAGPGNSPGGAVTITATHSASGVSAEAKFRIWFPTAIVVHAEDTTLNAIAGIRGQDCLQTLYQSTALRASATFSAGTSDGTELLIQGLDVSDLVSLMSSDTDSIAVGGKIALGLTPSASPVDITLQDVSPAVSITAASVSVTANEVSVIGLDVVAVTGASWASGQHKNIPMDYDETYSATFVAEQILSAEGAAATVFVFPVFNDEMRPPVPLSTAVVRLESLAVSDLNVTATLDDHFVVTVPVGATSACGPLLSASLLDECDGSILTTGSAVVDVTIPLPTSITLGPENDSQRRITRASNDASLAPIGLPQSVQLTVRVGFEFGDDRIVTTDDRTQYNVTQNAHLASMSTETPGLLVVNELASGSGNVTVEISFAGLKASVQVKVVSLSSVELSLHPFPSYTGSTGVAVTSIFPLACTGAYQRAVPSAVALLSDGASVDITAEATFTSTNSYILQVTTANHRIRGVRAGAAAIQASFGANSSAVYGIVVSDTPVSVAEVHLETPFSAQSTFSSEVSTTKSLTARVVWSDGTQYLNAVNGPSASWAEPSLYLAFTSDVPSAVAVSGDGVATLLANHDQEVVLTASASCAGDLPAAGTQSIAANLLPANGDVDLGAPYGPQFPSGLSVGETFDVAVRIRADQALKGYDIMLSFDDSVVHVATDDDCAMGSDWADAWGCGVNNMGATDEVLVQGSSATGTSTGTLEVAVITFTVVGNGVSGITGYITEMIRASGADEATNLVAGEGEVVIGGGRRRQLASAPLRQRRHRAEGAALQRRRSLSQAGGACKGGSYAGDTNGDCSFGIADIIFMQKHSLGMNLDAENDGPLTAWQLSQLDPTQRGGTDGIDITYLMSCKGGTYKFLEELSVEAANGALVLSARLKGDGDLIATDFDSGVRFEIGSSLNADMEFSVGTDRQVTDAGVMISATYDAATQSFRAVASGPDGASLTAETDVGVAVVVNTFNAMSETAPKRRFAFWGASIVEGIAFDPIRTVDIVEAGGNLMSPPNSSPGAPSFSPPPNSSPGATGFSPPPNLPPTPSPRPPPPNSSPGASRFSPPPNPPPGAPGFSPPPPFDDFSDTPDGLTGNQQNGTGVIDSDDGEIDSGDRQDDVSGAPGVDDTASNGDDDQLLWLLLLLLLFPMSAAALWAVRRQGAQSAAYEAVVPNINQKPPPQTDETLADETLDWLERAADAGVEIGPDGELRYGGGLFEGEGPSWLAEAKKAGVEISGEGELRYTGEELKESSDKPAWREEAESAGITFRDDGAIVYGGNLFGGTGPSQEQREWLDKAKSAGAVVESDTGELEYKYGGGLFSGTGPGVASEQQALLDEAKEVGVHVGADGAIMYGGGLFSGTGPNVSQSAWLEKAQAEGVVVKNEDGELEYDPSEATPQQEMLLNEARDLGVHVGADGAIMYGGGLFSDLSDRPVRMRVDSVEAASYGGGLAAFQGASSGLVRAAGKRWMPLQKVVEHAKTRTKAGGARPRASTSREYTINPLNAFSGRFTPPDVEDSSGGGAPKGLRGAIGRISRGLSALMAGGGVMTITGHEENSSIAPTRPTRPTWETQVLNPLMLDEEQEDTRERAETEYVMNELAAMEEARIEELASVGSDSRPVGPTVWTANDSAMQFTSNPVLEEALVRVDLDSS